VRVNATRDPLAKLSGTGMNSFTSSNNSYPYTSILLAASAMAGSAGSVGSADESAQSILDDHVSLIWNSAGPTPSRSPAGRMTPDSNVHAHAGGVMHAHPGGVHAHPGGVNVHSSSYQKHSPTKLLQRGDVGKTLASSSTGFPNKDTKPRSLSSSIWTRDQRSTQPSNIQPPVPATNVAPSRRVVTHHPTHNSNNGLRGIRSLSAQRPQLDLPQTTRTHPSSEIFNKGAVPSGNSVWVPPAVFRNEKPLTRITQRKNNVEPLFDSGMNVDHHPHSHDLQALNLPDAPHAR